MKPDSPDVCPVCGEDVPPNARACPECGADERAGWNEDATYQDDLDLPTSPEEEEADGFYQAFLEREFGVVSWKKRALMIFGFILIVVMAVYLFRLY